MTKEARNLKKIGLKKNLNRDLVIPNSCPFKLEVLQKLQKEKEVEMEIMR
jgi:hypothetical protein